MVARRGLAGNSGPNRTQEGNEGGYSKNEGGYSKVEGQARCSAHTPSTSLNTVQSTNLYFFSSSSHELGKPHCGFLTKGARRAAVRFTPIDINSMHKSLNFFQYFPQIGQTTPLITDKKALLDLH